MMAGVYRSHPNNIIYLTEKFSLATKDIGRILAMIDPAKRQRYDYGEIERLYMDYTARQIDDAEAVNRLREIFSGRELAMMLREYHESVKGKCTVKFITPSQFEAAFM